MWVGSRKYLFLWKRISIMLDNTDINLRRDVINSLRMAVVGWTFLVMFFVIIFFRWDCYADNSIFLCVRKFYAILSRLFFKDKIFEG